MSGVRQSRILLLLLAGLLFGCAVQRTDESRPPSWKILQCRYFPAEGTAESVPREGIPVRFGVSLQEQGWTGVGHRGRIAAWVEVPGPLPPGPVAVCAGFVGNAAELRWNGEVLATLGSLQRRATPSPGSLLWGWVEREAVRTGTGRSNLLEIAFVNTAGAAGTVGGPSGLFHSDDLEHHRRVRELGRSMLRGGAVALCAVWTVLLWMGRASRWRARELIGASAPTVCLGALGLVRSPWMVEWIGNGRWPRLVEGTLTLLVPLCFYGHFRAVFQPARRWLDLGIVAATVAYVLSYGRLAAIGTDWAVGGLAAVLAAVGVAVYGLGISAHRSGDPDARVLLAAWTLVLLLTGLQLLPAWVGSIRFAAHPLWFSDLVAPAWVLCLGALSLRRQHLVQLREAAWREQLLRAHVEERRRIGRELHDGVAQDLEAARLRTRLQAPDVPWARALSEALDSAVNEVRRLSADLQPAAGDPLAVESSLRALARADGPPTVEVGIDSCALGRLDPSALEQVHRMAQEGVRNALRHANASRVRVRLALVSGSVELTVEDDGLGFDPERATRRLGLRFLRDRAQLCGATFAVRSSPGEGCRLQFRFPLAQGPAATAHEPDPSPHSR